MAYEVTATRKRPQSFSQLVGQEFVSATLASSIRQGRIAHAYLFAGPRGVGKTSVARILARALNCDKGPTDTPCGTCPSCLEIARGSSLDVIEIDGASNTSVNDVREIRDEVLFAPNAARYKVYIIDEVHMLSNSAFNALLKTIEEPPPYIVFIFATTEAHKVPATIRSRCQQYNFRLISTAEIKAKLTEAAQELGVQAEERAMTWIAKEATGSLRDAYTLLDQVVSFSQGSITLERIREKLGVLGIEELNEFVGLLRAGDMAKVLERADGILATGVSIEQLVADLAEYFRNLLFLKAGITKDTLLGYAPQDFDSSLVQSLSLPQLEKAIELLLGLYRNIRFSLNQRFELELTLSRLAQLDSLISVSDIREALQVLKGEILASPGVQQAAAARFTLTPAAPAAPAVAQAVPAARTAPPGAAAPRAPAAAASSAAPAAKPVEVKQAVAMIADSLRREKPALAFALERASVALEGDEVVLAFSAHDRFQGEVVVKDKEALAARFSKLLSVPVKIRLDFHEVRQEPVKVDQRVELLRKVFRGEVVKGEGHGDESI